MASAAVDWAAPAIRTVRDTLEEALKSPLGGEVVVRSGDAVGYIHVQGGFIVWANLSTVPATMEEVARHAGVALDADMAAAVREECRTRRAHFMDVLVDWGLVAVERAREAVRAFVAERVRLILELPDAASLFLPKARQHSEHLRFGIDEIPSTRRPVQGSLTPFLARAPSSPRLALDHASLGAVDAVFEAARRIPGATGVAILDRRTGGTVLVSGVEMDGPITWCQTNLLAALGPEAEDVIGSTRDHCHVIRPLQEAPALALLVVLSLAETTIGLARLMVARLAAAPVPLVVHARQDGARARPGVEEQAQRPARQPPGAGQRTRPDEGATEG